MRWFWGLVAGILISLSVSSPALAHEEGVHIGELEIPLVVVWISGIVVVLILLLFLISWMNFRRARQQQSSEGRVEIDQKGEQDGS